MVQGPGSPQGPQNRGTQGAAARLVQRSQQVAVTWDARMSGFGVFQGLWVTNVFPTKADS